MNHDDALNPDGDALNPDGIAEKIPSERLREEYAQLVDDVRRYRFAYYNEDAPLVSDAEFDSMSRRLNNLSQVDFGYVSSGYQA